LLIPDFFTAIQHPDHCTNCIFPDVEACSADLTRKQQQFKLPRSSTMFTGNHLLP